MSTVRVTHKAPPPPPKPVVDTVTIIMSEREALALAALLGCFGSEWGELPNLYSMLADELGISCLEGRPEYNRLRNKAESAIKFRAVYCD